MRSRSPAQGLQFQSAAKERLPPDIHLFEILQGVAPLMAKVDRFFEIQRLCCEHQRYQVATCLMSELEQYDDNLKNWCHNLSTSFNGPICWDELSSFWIAETPTSAVSETFASMLCFSSIRTATSLLFAWTGLLFLHRARDILRLLRVSNTPAVFSADDTALLIARSFEYFLHPDIGLFGTYMIGFPLSVSRSYFEQREMQDELLWLDLIECRIEQLGSGLCDFLREVKSESILPRLRIVDQEDGVRS